MTPENPEAEEEQLAAWLAAYDEALAAGNNPVSPDHAAPPPAQPGQFQQELAWLQRARQLLKPALRTAPANKGEPVQSVPAPQTCLGRFQIRRELGRGGFGVVLLAYDPLWQREVALKVPQVDTLFSPSWRERFQSEILAASALSHPNLVPFYEAGAVGPVYYLASAYCPGPTLAAWLQERREPVPFSVAALLLAAIADGVEHANQRGVLHCDLKPGNVLLSPEPETANDLGFIPRVTDFGLSKLLEDDVGSGLTQSGAIVGTVAYMAPEQAGGRKHLSPAADVYALGAILYELLTGQPPFRGTTDRDTLLRGQRDEPVPLTRLRPGLPCDLETICLKCLHKATKGRYASAEALATDLQRFVAGEPIAARPAGTWQRAWCWAKQRLRLREAPGAFRSPD